MTCKAKKEGGVMICKRCHLRWNVNDSNHPECRTDRQIHDLDKIYYLDKDPESKRNIPFDTNFRILHVKGYGTSVCQKFGSYEFNKWLLKDTQEEVHPLGWSYYKKWVAEPKKDEKV